MRELVVLRLEGKGNERGETARLVLQFPETAQMIDPVRHSFDMTIQHGAGAALAHLVPDAMHFKPFLRAFLAPANLVADGRIKNFRATAGERAKSRLAQNLQRFANRFFGNPLRQMPNLDGGERL